MTTEGRQPTEEELRAFEEQMRRIAVPDLLIQTAVTLVNVGGMKLGEDGDLEQARLAIEATRVLLPLLPDEVQPPIKDALSQLQMAFVRESQGGGDDEQRADQPEQPQQPRQADDEAERAKARSKIWTPPGT